MMYPEVLSFSCVISNGLIATSVVPVFRTGTNIPVPALFNPFLEQRRTGIRTLKKFYQVLELMLELELVIIIQFSSVLGL